MLYQFSYFMHFALKIDRVLRFMKLHAQIYNRALRVGKERPRTGSGSGVETGGAARAAGRTLGGAEFLFLRGGSGCVFTSFGSRGTAWLLCLQHKQMHISTACTSSRARRASPASVPGAKPVLSPAHVTAVPHQVAVRCEPDPPLALLREFSRRKWIHRRLPLTRGQHRRLALLAAVVLLAAGAGGSAASAGGGPVSQPAVGRPATAAYHVTRVSFRHWSIRR